MDPLRLAGAAVTFIVEEDKGHETPSARTLQAFSSWLARLVGKP